MSSCACAFKERVRVDKRHISIILKAFRDSLDFCSPLKKKSLNPILFRHFFSVLLNLLILVKIPSTFLKTRIEF